MVDQWLGRMKASRHFKTTSSKRCQQWARQAIAHQALMRMRRRGFGFSVGGTRLKHLVVAGTPDSPQEAAWLFGGWGHLSAEIRCPSSKVFSLMSQSYTTDDPRPEFLVWRLAIWQGVPLCLRLCPACTSTSAVFRCFWHNRAASIWGSGADVPFFGLSMLFESAKKSSILKHKKLSFTNRISTGDDCLAKIWDPKFDRWFLSCLNYPRAASEIHPKKRKFLEKNVKPEMHLVLEVLHDWL